MNPKVTINLLGWNSKKYLKQAFDSVLEQTYPNLEIVFIDNGSEDHSVDFVRKIFREIKIIDNKRNLGYAEGHNMGIRQASGQYVICMNPDIILEDDFVARAVGVMEKDDRVGALAGKLLQMKEDGTKTDIIDSTGFKIFKSRRVIDRGHGEADAGQYRKEEQVFGVSGALPVFRKKALQDVRIFGEYFDCDFENYKEDIDLSWRMNLYGWKCVYAPRAIAYHERGTGLGEQAKGKDFLREKKKHSFRAKYFSFKNHSLMLVKNDFLRHYLLDSPFILWYELKRWGYVLLREPRLFGSFLKLVKQLPHAFKKRRAIMANRRVKAREVRSFFE
ncbi:MAG: glycosyltransferase family 2 protein [Patescibacteria group bacterium]|nr:glycosyltransferase family 2 protein [Patescibacteria group bacterium]